MAIPLFKIKKIPNIVRPIKKKEQFFIHLLSISLLSLIRRNEKKNVTDTNKRIINVVLFVGSTFLRIGQSFQDFL